MKQPLVFPKIDTEDTDLQKLVHFYEETLGFCPNSVKTMHHRPRIAYAFIEMNKAVMQNNGRVTSGLKRLIGYIVSNAAGCRYCQAHTIRAAERYGTTLKQLENIWDFKTHSAFNEAERAALSLALAAAMTPNAVNDQIAEDVREYWNEGEIVEIMGVISLFGFLNKWNDSMGTELEPKAVESGNELLGHKGWEHEKHTY